MRLLELKNTSRPLFDWKLQVITFLVEKHSQKVLRKLPVSSRNVSKLPPGAPRGPPRSPSGPLRPLLACSGVLGDRFRDARGPTRTTENLCFPLGIQRFSLLRQPWLFFGFRLPTGDPRGLRESRFSAPAPLPLEYFTRLFLEYTVLLEPFFLGTPARRTWGRRIREACDHFRRPRSTANLRCGKRSARSLLALATSL